MTENYREQQHEETEGIVDAGAFVNDPGTGMVAEDQETAAAADIRPDTPVQAPSQNDEEAIEETEASESTDVDLHEDAGSGIDVAVIVIIVLIICAGIFVGIWNATNDAQQQQIIAQQQAANKEYEAPYEVVELPEGVAAIVNGEVIEESTVEEYMIGFRSMYGLQDEADWSAWLIIYGYTPDQVRDVAISTYVEDALVRQAVKEYGIVASQEAIDEIYNAARANFATEKDWEEGLKAAGMTESSFREQCKLQAEQAALKKYLGEHWFATPEDEDAELLVAVKQYYPKYADVESLDGISEEELEPVREMVVMYAESDAYNKFLKDAKESGDVKMSVMPSDTSYESNPLLGLFRTFTLQMEAAQQGDQQQ